MEQDTHFRRFNRGYWFGLFTNLLTNLGLLIVNKYRELSFEIPFIFCLFTKTILKRNSICLNLVNLVPKRREDLKYG